MAIKNIVFWPDAELCKPSAVVADFGEGLKQKVKDLFDTMGSEPMAGLAAPQIGINLRFFACDIDPDDNDGNGTDGPEVFINPEIIKKEGEFTWEEGCMSIPGFKGQVTRSYQVVMRYQDLEGNFHEREAMDYLSGCFQHELDHLNGVLWVDYQSPTKKSFIKKKMLKLKQSIEQERA